MSGSIKRLYSFGFLFGGRDDGAVETTQELSESMDALKTNVLEVGASSNRLQRFGNTINAITVGQLSRVNDTLSGLAERAGSMGASADDTQMESFGAQFGQTFRQATAGLGQYREEVDRLRGQISGTAFNLQVDAGDILGAVTRVARTGRSLSEYGLTVRDLGGSIQANILSGEQLGNMLTGLSEGYDLGAAGATNMMDTVTAIGERVGAGADAMRGLPAAIEAADAVISALPANAAPAIDEVLVSITSLAAATVDRLGGDFPTAMAKATEAFTTLGAQRTQLTDLVTGVASDFPEMATQIGIASGDIDGSIENIMSNPLEFAANMRTLSGSLEPGSHQADVLARVLRAMPEAFRFLVTGGDEATAAIERARVPVENVTGAFRNMARSASGSSRTFGEAMTVLAANHETALNSMTTLTNSEVLGKQREAYQRMGNYLESWRSSSGPLGLITQGFLDFRRHGVIGLTGTIRRRLGPAFPWLADSMESILPAVAGVGGGLIEMASDMGPMLLVMSQMRGSVPGLGSAVGLLLNPWTLLVAGIAAAVYYWDDLGPLIDRGAGYLEDFAEVATEWVASVDWQAMGDSIAAKLSEMFSSFGEGGRARGIVTSLATAIRQLMAGAGEALSGMSVGIFGDAGGGMLNSIFGFLWDSTNISNLQDAIEGGNWADILFEGIWTALGPLYGMLRSGLTGLFGFDVIDEVWNSVLKPTFEDLVGFWTSDIYPLVLETIDLLGDLGDIAVALWNEDLKPALIALKRLWNRTWVQWIKPQTLAVLRAVGEAASSMWTGYIRPALLAMARLWAANMEMNQRQSINVFHAVLTVGVRTFFGIQTAIGRLGIAWNHWRQILANGWNLIGVAVRNSVGIALEYAHHNFTELVNGWETGLLRIKHGFLNLPVMVLSAFRSLIEDNPLSGLFDRLGIDLGVASSALDNMESTLTGPGSALHAINEQLANAETATETRAREHARRMDQMRTEIADQARATVQSYREMDDADEQYTRSQEARRDRVLDGVNHMRDRMLEISGSFNDRIQQFIEDAASGEMARRHSAREATDRAEEMARSVAPMMDQLTQAAESGAITTSQFESAANMLASSMEGGQSAVDSMVDRVGSSLLAQMDITRTSDEAESEEEASATGRRRQRRTRRRPRVRAKTQSGGTSPAQRDRERRETRESAAVAEREANAEMAISVFGPQAVRQLRDAFRGGTVTTRRGPRVGTSGSAGDVH